MVVLKAVAPEDTFANVIGQYSVLGSRLNHKSSRKCDFLVTMTTQFIGKKSTSLQLSQKQHTKQKHKTRIKTETSFTSVKV